MNSLEKNFNDLKINIDKKINLILGSNLLNYKIILPYICKYYNKNSYLIINCNDSFGVLDNLFKIANIKLEFKIKNLEYNIIDCFNNTGNMMINELPLTSYNPNLYKNFNKLENYNEKNFNDKNFFDELKEEINNKLKKLKFEKKIIIINNINRLFLMISNKILLIDFLNFLVNLNKDYGVIFCNNKEIVNEDFNINKYLKNISNNIFELIENETGFSQELSGKLNISNKVDYKWLKFKINEYNIDFFDSLKIN